MRACRIAAITIVAGGVLAGACFGQKQGEVIKTRPLVVVDGDDSKVTRGALVCVSTDKEWNETWAEHVGIKVEHVLEKRLEVDFSRVMVVAVFLGDSVNCNGIEVTEILESPSFLTIRVTRRGYQSHISHRPDPPERPYAFIVLPKSDKEIVLEEDRQRLKGQPPLWKVRARLPRPSSPSSE
jgi:hypothetical protein